MTKTANAFAPGGISSFFEICSADINGNQLADLDLIGARGGGFVIEKGVRTHVEVQDAKNSSIQIFINGILAPEAETSRSVAKTLLAKTDGEHKVTINHTVDIPIGAGFGSSAGGALGTAIALSAALDLNLTYNHLGKIAHAEEIKCETGLGTVGPIMLGGCILTLEPGAPGVCVIDRIPISERYSVVTGVFGPTPTSNILSSMEKRREVNKWGSKTLELILEDPSLENLLSRCLEFAERTGFMTKNVKQLVNLSMKAGAVGVAQNMVGEAAHALVLDENVGKVEEAFKQILPKERVLRAKIDFQGARLLG